MPEFYNTLKKRIESRIWFKENAFIKFGFICSLCFSFVRALLYRDSAVAGQTSERRFLAAEQSVIISKVLTLKKYE
jgi:hypothetical protein